MATTLMSCWSTRQGTTQRSTLHQPAQAALWQQHVAVSHDTAGTRHYAEPRSQQGPCPTLAFNHTQALERPQAAMLGALAALRGQRLQRARAQARQQALPGALARAGRCTAGARRHARPPLAAAAADRARLPSGRAARAAAPPAPAPAGLGASLAALVPTPLRRG